MLKSKSNIINVGSKLKMNGFKKLFNFLLIIVGIILIVVCADLVVNKTVNTSFESLEKLDKNAIEDVCDVISLLTAERAIRRFGIPTIIPKKWAVCWFRTAAELHMR